MEHPVDRPSFHTDLQVEIGPLRLKNPVIAASGTFGYGDEYAALYDPSVLGGLVLKGLSLAPRAGNPPPRIVETPAGMLNAIGLANMGVERFITEKVPLLKEMETVAIANIYGHSLEEYGAVARRLDEVTEIAALEVNISCPNVAQGGMAFGTDPEQSANVTRRVRDNTEKPVIVKLSPNVTDLRPIAVAVEQAGATAISLINTITGMAVDVESRKPRLGNVTGGLSGPAIRPVALRMVYEAVHAVRIPVIGIGGILTARDALEFLIAGASAVQVGTAHFVDPLAGIRILEGLDAYCVSHHIPRLSDLIGSLRVP